MTHADAASRAIVLPDAPPEQQAILDAGGVACWSEPVRIDTYEPGPPDPFPLFLERRVYQGSSGRLYPMPIIDEIAHESTPRAWQAVHLENEHVRLMLLPEIGGRIHIGHDKHANYDFFYRNNVIKPALVGLGGPWISGGVEFNWPQHHRPGTFLPVEWRIDREDDGAVVVWHSDLDPLQRMRARHGVRLHPDSSLIEAEVHAHNRTDTPQTFLWWANVAARVHDQYQSFFPDDVRYVADHARRAITAFPAADRPYYGVDYPALAHEREGADRLDFYSNIPVPTSYMITDTEHAFFGGYDHRANAGFVHWADPSISPGKKQWTWGDGPIGHAWDRQLTDADGPYVELMAGVYTDNQPDFAWLAPGETKVFSQYWYPIQATGPARQASRDAAVSVTEDEGGITIGVNATHPIPAAEIIVRSSGEVVERWSGDLSPAQPVVLRVRGVRESEASIEVRTDRRSIVQWRPSADVAEEPWVATVPPLAEQMQSTDELVTTAIHLDQYRHPTRSSRPYLERALDLDGADARAATMLAAGRLREGRYKEAIELAERATGRLQARNLNPRDGEAHYTLGLALERTGDHDRADAAFARAAWLAAWSRPASLARARLALRSGRHEDASRLAADSGPVPEAQRLVALADACAGDDASFERRIAQMMQEDPLDPVTRALAGATPSADPRALIDAACEFARCGAYEVALQATAGATAAPATAFGNHLPILHYLRAVWLEASGHPSRAALERTTARDLDDALCFPAGLDHYDALQAAVSADPTDGTAHALLGMWLIDAGRDGDAARHLEQAVDAGRDDARTLRNLAIARVRHGGDLDAADTLLHRALQAQPAPRLVLERDGLARARGLSTGARLDMMQPWSALLTDRDDLAIVYVELLLDLGRASEAWSVLTTRTFRPFEGGEGRVIDAYDRAASAMARTAQSRGDILDALTLLGDGYAVPDSLGEGRHPATHPAERLVTLGDAHAAADDRASARRAWEAALASSPLDVSPSLADRRAYWRGIAALRLGDEASARRTWEALDDHAAALDSAGDVPDYFATSLPELLVFDTDTPEHRARQAEGLRALARQGRAEMERR